MLCAECLAFPKPYERARAVFSYENPCRQMILAFKHGDQTHLAPSFATWLKTGGAEFLGEADALVPVPLHWLRLLKRRYNQAALLGRELGKKSGIPHWPDVLKRVRNTPSQGHKGVGNRRKNVSGVFVLAPSWREKTPGKRLVLIDDVLTTGATVEECARVLIQEGKAARVDVLTIARVLRDRDRLAT